MSAIMYAGNDVFLACHDNMTLGQIMDYAEAAKRDIAIMRAATLGQIKGVTPADRLRVEMYLESKSESEQRIQDFAHYGAFC